MTDNTALLNGGDKVELKDEAQIRGDEAGMRRGEAEMRRDEARIEEVRGEGEDSQSGTDNETGYSTNDEEVGTQSEDDNNSTASEGMVPRISDGEFDEEMYIFDQTAKRRAINNCVLFTVLLFTVPFTVMYLTYLFVFKGYFGLDDSSAALYAGMVGIVLVIMLVVMFVVIAYKEDKAELEWMTKNKKTI